MVLAHGNGKARSQFFVIGFREAFAQWHKATCAVAHHGDFILLNQHKHLSVQMWFPVNYRTRMAVLNPPSWFTAQLASSKHAIPPADRSMPGTTPSSTDLH